jgi:nucleotide-binding universal stress UspA family protein
LRPISQILVPVNGSPTDDEAIRLASITAKRYKARVLAIYVIEVKRTLPLDAEIQPEIEKGELVLDHAERVAEENDAEIQTELLQSREVGPAIVEEAIERNVDVIIMGLPYKRRFGEFSLGTTALYVLKNAPCRVWVLREPMHQ